MWIYVFMKHKRTTKSLHPSKTQSPWSCFRDKSQCFQPMLHSLEDKRPIDFSTEQMMGLLHPGAFSSGENEIVSKEVNSGSWLLCSLVILPTLPLSVNWNIKRTIIQQYNMVNEIWCKHISLRARKQSPHCIFNIPQIFLEMLYFPFGYSLS